MSIPKYDELLRPLLELASKQEITRRLAGDAMATACNLSEEEKLATIPSGASTYIHHRTGWAMTFLTKGKLIEKVARATYKATTFGTEFLAQHPSIITVKDLERIEGWKEAWNTKAAQKRRAEKDGESPSVNILDTTSPEELIGEAIESLNSGLMDDIQESLSSVDPYFFERIVLDVLVAMGYGGSREEAAKVTSKSNDGGIDGIINEDRLGLDVIYIQAKRHKATVGRVDIQNFVGALAGKQANKGIFITTSGFNQNAIDYASTVPQKVILINGERLTQLMIEHNVGVSTERVISIKKLDSDYFDDI